MLKLFNLNNFLVKKNNSLHNFSDLVYNLKNISFKILYIALFNINL